MLGLTDRLEGSVRGASHFRAVTTVVTKLLNIVAPDIAYFGQKDAQQLIVIRRLVEDLNLPVRIAAAQPYASPTALRCQAATPTSAPTIARARSRFTPACARLLEAASRGERSAAELVGAARAAMAPFEVEPEYLALVSPDTLEPVARLDAPALLAVAARVGSTRLIDNIMLDPALTPSQRPAIRQRDPRSLDSTGDPSSRTPTPREAQATCSA